MARRRQRHIFRLFLLRVLLLGPGLGGVPNTLYSVTCAVTWLAKKKGAATMGGPKSLIFQVQTHYKEAESHYGSDLLNLVVAKGYLTKLLANRAVQSFIQRHEPEILKHFELVVNTVSMEEAVQQRNASDQLTEALDPHAPQAPQVDGAPLAESELSE